MSYLSNRFSLLLIASLITSMSAACSPAGAPGVQPSTTPTTVPSVAQSNLNGCTSYVDRTGDSADRDIKWDFSVASDTERCMKIKVGQSVTFAGNFSTHPLKNLGGDSPNPFSGAGELVSNPGLAGQEFAAVKFDKAGSFGFVCTAHSNMKGAIQVVP